MKNNYLKIQISLILIFIFTSINVYSQTNHAVEVSSNKFDPKEITIQVGDTVTWTNIGGTHNVNGTKTTFPNNPESFGNNVDSDWTFSFVFNTAGTYDYQCDPHAGFGMVGKVIVQGETTKISNPKNSFEVSFYPNPVDDQLNIVLADPTVQFADLTVYNVVGERVGTFSGIEILNSKINLQLAGLRRGLYFLNIQSGDQQSAIKFLKE